MSYFVHETAVIDDGATIGKEARIWHFTHICAGAIIGEAVSLGQNVFVSNKVVIGNKCKIQNNVSLYDNITLEDGVFCGPSMVFTNVVKKGASLGANCTIVCGITIGAFAFIGAGAVVNKDVPNYALFVGVPARQIGWVSEYGERLDLPLEGHAEAICQHTNHHYKLEGTVLTRIA